MIWKIVFPVLAAVFTVGLGAMVGGLRDIDVNDEGVQNALNFAVVQHNRGTNDLYLSEVAEVVKAQSQVSNLSFALVIILFIEILINSSVSKQAAV